MASPSIAEQKVVASLLINPSLIDTIEANLQQKTFANEIYGAMYGAISDLHLARRPIDEVTVSVQSKFPGLTPEYIREFQDGVGNIVPPESLREHAETICSARFAEFIEKCGGRITSLAADPQLRANRKDLDGAISEIVLKMSMAGDSSGSSASSYSAILPGYLRELKERRDRPDGITGLSTGIARLDELTLGLQRQDLIIVAARPSMGKTTFALNLIEEAALGGGHCIVFSMEMPKPQLLQRSLAKFGKIDINRLRSGRLTDEDLEKLASATKQVDALQIDIDDSPGLTIAEVKKRCYKAHAKNPLSCVMVDYIQLMNGVTGENRNAQIEEISRGLKQLAKDLNCPVIALSQLNRSLESRANRRPLTSDLRDSGAIEQDADVILFLYRDEVYNASSPDKGLAEIIIGKQRNGPLDTVIVGFEGKYASFHNTERTALGGDSLPL